MRDYCCSENCNRTYSYIKTVSVETNKLWYKKKNTVQHYDHITHE